MNNDARFLLKHLYFVQSLNALKMLRKEILIIKLRESSQ